MTQTITPIRAVQGSGPLAGQARRTDDLMECAFAVEGRAGGEPLSPVDARRVGHMRTLVAARLRYLGLSAMRETAEMIVSELVTNAIKHGGGNVTLSLLVTRSEARLFVRDCGSDQPQLAVPSVEAEGGRGLLIVDLLAAELGGSWGFIPESRTAWCVLPVPHACP